MDGDQNHQHPERKANNTDRDRESRANSESNAGEMGSSYMGHSDDDFDYANYEESDMDEFERGSTSNTDNQLPLIPTDFTSILEAMQNFSAVFDSRYGAQHAPFFQGSLQDAIVEAFDAPGRGVEERRPLAIYLHNDQSVAAHIFAQNVMSDVDVSSLLKCQFVVWAWDVSLHQNKQSFYEWMSISGLNTVLDSFKMMPTSKYPLLLTLVRERGVIMRSAIVFGQDRAAITTERLLGTLNYYQTIKEQDSAEERNRMEREQFRQEQVEEYQRGLEADRAKKEAILQKRQREEDAEKKRKNEELEKEKYRNTLATILPSEPAENDPLSITIRLRFPDGHWETRRFRSTESLEVLLIYAETLGIEAGRYRIWTSDMPKKEVAKLGSSKTFAELNWARREQLTIEEL